MKRNMECRTVGKNVQEEDDSLSREMKKYETMDRPIGRFPLSGCLARVGKLVKSASRYRSRWVLSFS